MQSSRSVMGLEWYLHCKKKINKYKLSQHHFLQCTFLTVADGKLEVASRSKLEKSVLFFIRDGGPVIKVSVLLKFKLRKLEYSQSFNSLTHEDKEAIEWVESGWQAVYTGCHQQNSGG